MAQNFQNNSLKTHIAILMVILIGIAYVSRQKEQFSEPGEQGIRVAVTQQPDAPSEPGQDEHQTLSEIGYASYYGDEFHGQPTASGEMYDKNTLTAAHREYPFDTRVRVTNLTNNKSVIVRINDRGPLKVERLIDLSERAAREIGLLQRGVVKVKIEMIE